MQEEQDFDLFGYPVPCFENENTFKNILSYCDFSIAPKASTQRIFAPLREKELQLLDFVAAFKSKQFSILSYALDRFSLFVMKFFINYQPEEFNIPFLIVSCFLLNNSDVNNSAMNFLMNLDEPPFLNFLVEANLVNSLIISLRTNTSSEYLFHFASVLNKIVLTTDNWKKYFFPSLSFLFNLFTRSKFNKTDLICLLTIFKNLNQLNEQEFIPVINFLESLLNRSFFPSRVLFLLTHLTDTSSKANILFKKFSFILDRALNNSNLEVRAAAVSVLRTISKFSPDYVRLDCISLDSDNVPLVIESCLYLSQLLKFYPHLIYFDLFQPVGFAYEHGNIEVKILISYLITLLLQVFLLETIESHFIFYLVDSLNFVGPNQTIRAINSLCELFSLDLPEEVLSSIYSDFELANGFEIFSFLQSSHNEDITTYAAQFQLLFSICYNLH